MKKLFIAVLCLVLTVGGLFAGCGIKRGDPDNYEVNLDISRDTEATLSILIPNSNYEKDLMRAAEVGFKKIFPNVTIRLSTFQMDNYNQTIMQQSAAGTLPDLVWSNTPQFFYLVEKQLALNLNKYFSESVNAGYFDLEDDFVTEFMDMGKYENKQFLVPRSTDTVVTFINTDILTKAGVDMNPATTKVKNGWSWEDFLEVCAKVRKYNDDNDKPNNYVIDQNLITWESVIYPWLLSMNADLFDADGNVIVDSEGTREALAMLKELVDKRYVGGGNVTAATSYESGGSAMLFQSASISHYVDRPVLKGKSDIVSFPLMNAHNNAKIGAGLAGYTINTKSNQKDLAWQFLAYLLSYNGQQDTASGGLNLPSIRTDLQDYKETFTDDYGQPVWGKGYEDYNLDAYLYAPEKKVAVDFVAQFDPGHQTDLIQALIDLFLDVSKGVTIDKAIADCKAALTKIVK